MLRRVGDGSTANAPSIVLISYPVNVSFIRNRYVILFQEKVPALAVRCDTY